MAAPLFDFIVNNDPLSCHLTITGDIKTQYANLVKEQLQRIIESTGDVSVNMEEATDLDCSAIQLIYSLKLIIQQQGRKVTILLPSGKNLQALLRKSGITKIL